MAITDISISEELKTNAPSIKYRGNEGPKSPQEIEMMMSSVDDPFYRSGDEDEHSFRMFGKPYKELNADELEEFREEMMRLMNKFSKGPILPSPEDPVNPFGPKPQGPVLPDRQMAAYGGIMGLDGRKQYGAGSWFQENVMDNYKKYVLGQTQKQIDDDSQKRVDEEDAAFGKNYENPIDTFLKGKREDPDDPDSKRTGGQAQNIIPAVGGVLAGLFTKNSENDTPGLPSDVTALAIDDLKKSANILDQKQGMAAGLNFLPAVAARKYSPSEMIEVYQNAANGGRIGFNMGGGIINPFNEFETFKLKNLGYDVAVKGTEPFGGESVLRDILRVNRANGGRIGFEEGGGIMDLGGMEKDYRAEGGFVPIGREEKADDVPARLSVNEFVFTADAVRNAGGGDIDQGAQVMENMMKHLEAGGQVSEESQGMAGARDMFATSQRLGDVI